jgi:hypothetical protein
LHRQIASQFQGKRTIPFVATDQEISHGCDFTWALRVKEAPQHIRESWVGTSWIVEMTVTWLDACIRLSISAVLGSPALSLYRATHVGGAARVHHRVKDLMTSCESSF